MDIITKFRAFQLNSHGSLFSFYKSNTYNLIEARIPKGGIGVLQADLEIHNKQTIDVLHITSWDTDHCCYDDLVQILNHFRPATIEVPDYTPESEESKLSRSVIMKYDDIHQQYIHNVKVISKEYIKSLSNAQSKDTSNVVFESSYNSDCKNDMSLIKLFRSLGFNVLSLGDCESADIANRLMDHSIIIEEVDVLILPHHGADNGFITEVFLRKVNPKIAVCSSNYDNQYDHPRQEIRNLLYEKGICLYTTKTGDIVIYHERGKTNSLAINLIAESTKISSQKVFTPKRFS
jgi:competence protein ComEC